MSKGRGWRRAAILTLALMLAAIVPAGASAGNSDGKHCIAPWGADLNEEWGISEAIVWVFCTEVGTGEDWRVAAGWGVAPSFKKVPKGFEPTGATPLEDFMAKFVGTKIVTDPGTAQERTTIFTDPSGLMVTLFDDGGAGINSVTMGTLDPLSTGRHVVESYWTMNAMHCDGGGRSIADNCLVAGDNFGFSVEIEVTPNQG